MTFRNRMNDPKAMTSVGMTCLATGLLLLLLLHPAAKFGQDWVHGLGGLLLGISFVMNLKAVRLTARQRRSSKG